MPAACMVPCLLWTSCAALGTSHGFPGLQFLIIVKGRAPAQCTKVLGRYTLQGRCDEAVGFLRFILQGQSNREPPKYWLASIQKWKLFIMSKMFQETKILNKILPFLPLSPHQKKLQLMLLKHLIKSHLSFSSAFPSGLCTSREMAPQVCSAALIQVRCVSDAFKQSVWSPCRKERPGSAGETLPHKPQLRKQLCLDRARDPVPHPTTPGLTASELTLPPVSVFHFSPWICNKAELQTQ